MINIDKMKKTILITSITLINTLTYGQDSRVGINTDNPNSSLHVSEKKSLPPEQPQGVIFPTFTSKERALFENPARGTMIFNQDLNCLEIYTYKDGELQWVCTGCLCASRGAGIINLSDDYFGPAHHPTDNPTTPSVYDNDTFNGIDMYEAVYSDYVEVSLVSEDSGGYITFNPDTGQFTVLDGIASGVYKGTYKVCEKDYPSNCATASAFIEVLADTNFP